MNNYLNDNVSYSWFYTCFKLFKIKFSKKSDWESSCLCWVVRFLWTLRHRRVSAESLQRRSLWQHAGQLQVCLSLWIQKQQPAEQLPRWRPIPVGGLLKCFSLRLHIIHLWIYIIGGDLFCLPERCKEKLEFILKLYRKKKSGKYKNM